LLVQSKKKFANDAPHHAKRDHRAQRHAATWAIDFDRFLFAAPLGATINVLPGQETVWLAKYPAPV
jgi:hypothetical protein